ncbi:hypothetical protein HK097_009617 [Rhizophlyctis rosea]|uniref:Phosphoribosylglycinamide formyltransferase n=1 Tax=Rhizophlyctis rosea TaxID=64517 RepID=A0AAD5SBG4_9FUNG|nr:hypothetical protein HK097_009617 [Rhizophlyctis rosea]
MTTPPPRIVVLISGSGTNLQALIDASQSSSPPHYKISLVLSNKPSAYGLTRAANAQIPTLSLSLKSYRESHPTASRTDYDTHLASLIRSHLSQDPIYKNSPTPDLIVLAGFMHILSPQFLSSFSDGRIINLHPALPGAFDGAHAIERAFEAFQKGEITETGVMVHKVIPEVDRGEVVLVRSVPIHKEDTLEKLEERIHSVEHGLIVEGTKKMLGVA